LGNRRRSILRRKDVIARKKFGYKENLLPPQDWSEGKKGLQKKTHPKKTISLPYSEKKRWGRRLTSKKGAGTTQAERGVKKSS